MDHSRTTQFSDTEQSVIYDALRIYWNNVNPRYGKIRERIEKLMDEFDVPEEGVSIEE